MASTLGLNGRVVAPLVEAADLEDGEVLAPLALVAHEHAEQPGQHRAAQLGVVAGHRVRDADRRRIIRRVAQPLVVDGRDQRVRQRPR